MLGALASALRTAIATGAKVLPRRWAGQIAQRMAESEARSTVKKVIANESWENFVARMHGDRQPTVSSPAPKLAGGSFDVLENANISNAKALQQALSGQPREDHSPTNPPSQPASSPTSATPPPAQPVTYPSPSQASVTPSGQQASPPPPPAAWNNTVPIPPPPPPPQTFAKPTTGAAPPPTSSSPNASSTVGRQPPDNEARDDAAATPPSSPPENPATPGVTPSIHSAATSAGNSQSATSPPSPPSPTTRPPATPASPPPQLPPLNAGLAPGYQPPDDASNRASSAPTASQQPTIPAAPSVAPSPPAIPPPTSPPPSASPPAPISTTPSVTPVTPANYPSPPPSLTTNAAGGAAQPPQPPRTPGGNSWWMPPPDDNSKDDSPFPDQGPGTDPRLFTPDAKTVAASGNWIDGLAERFDQWRQKRQQIAADRIPIAQQVAGLTYEQRHERLQKADALLPPEQVGRALGTPAPNLQQIVEHSERQQEEMRQERQKDLQGQTPGTSLSGTTTFAVTNTLAGGAQIFGVLAGASKLMEIFADKVSESNRGLSKFNGTLAASFAAKDIASIRSDWKTAQGTQGTGAMLNLELAKLIEEFQPIRQQIATGLNILATMAAKVVNMNIAFFKSLGIFETIQGYLKTLEDEAKKEAAVKAMLGNAPVRDMLRDMRDGKFSKPRNPPPGAP